MSSSLQASSEQIPSVHSVLFGEERTSITEILFLSPIASKCSLTTMEHQVLIFGFEELAGPGCVTCRTKKLCSGIFYASLRLHVTTSVSPQSLLIILQWISMAYNEIYAGAAHNRQVWGP